MRVGLAMAAVWLLATAPAGAQRSVDAPVRQIMAGNLAQALEHVGWDPARKGALLAIDPAHVQPWMPPPPPGQTDYHGPNPLMIRADRKPTLRAVAEHFGRKPIPVGTITALAPPAMVVLETDLKDPDIFNGVGRAERVRWLMASLSAAQWRLLGGSRGIGLSDLDKEQQALFLSVLPDPMGLQRYTVGPRTSQGYATQELDPNGRITLTPAQRAAVRIRIARGVSIVAGMVDTPGRMMLDPYNMRPEGARYTALSVNPEEYRPQDNAWGSQVRKEVPNRLKPGDLEFADTALDRAVALDGAKTVEDLVKRVATASGLELYADPRMGRWAVLARGNARAGDLLKALCLALTGTFRQVGPAYVLTDDREGLSVRRNRIDAWALQAEIQAANLRRQMEEKIAAQKPAQYLDYAEDEALTLPPDMQASIEDGWKNGQAGLELPMNRLSPALFAKTREMMLAVNQPLREDKVWIDQRTRVLLLLPDGTSVEDTTTGWGAISALRSPFPTRVPPMPTTPQSSGAFAGFERRILMIAPRDSNEAAYAVAQAKNRGWTEIWVPQVLGASTVALEATIAAAREYHLPVVAAVRYLRALDGSTIPPDRVDIDAGGRTTEQFYGKRAKSPSPFGTPWATLPALIQDWMRVDRPEALKPHQDALLKIGALPGLAGLVLRDTAAPGYSSSGEPGTQSFSMLAGWEGGYLPEWRLGFLRKESVDPVDIPAVTPYSSNRMNASLPFFDDAVIGARAGYAYAAPNANGAASPGVMSVTQRWGRFRYDANIAVMKDLHAALRAANKDLPLVIEGRGETPMPIQLYVAWDKPDALPDTMMMQNPSVFQSVRSRFRSPLLGLTLRGSWPGLPPGMTETDLLRMMAFSYGAAMQRESISMAGVVLDLSDRSATEALRLLETL